MRKFCLAVLSIFLCSILLTGCQTAIKEETSPVINPALIPDDSAEFAKIMESLQSGNDDLAKIKERHKKLVRETRAKHERLLKLEKQKFSAEEKKKRDAFNFRHNKERSNYISSTWANADEKERQDFFRDLGERRKEFLASEKQARDRFEGVIAQTRKKFDQEREERQKQFETQFFILSERQNSKGKSSLPAKGSRVAPGANQVAAAITPTLQNLDETLLMEFKKIPRVPSAVPLMPWGQ
jgi:hypothetical protein